MPPEWLTIWPCAIYDWLKDWQTIISGILAVGAAYFTIRTLRSQIELQKAALSADDLRTSEKRQSQQWAARAALPDALSQMIQSVFEKDSQDSRNVILGVSDPTWRADTDAETEATAAASV